MELVRERLHVWQWSGCFCPSYHRDDQRDSQWQCKAIGKQHWFLAGLSLGVGTRPLLACWFVSRYYMDHDRLIGCNASLRIWLPRWLAVTMEFVQMLLSRTWVVCFSLSSAYTTSRLQMEPRRCFQKTFCIFLDLPVSSIEPKAVWS